MEKAAARAATDARPAHRPTSPRSTGGSGPRRRWRPGATAPPSAWTQIAARCPPAEAAGMRTRTARRDGVARAWCSSTATATSESETAFAAALGAPGLDADLECRARFHRAQSVWKQRSARAPRRCSTRPRPPARGRQQRSARQGAVPGGALPSSAGDREAALAHYARVEAEHADHSYADDARLRRPSWRPTPATRPTAAKLLAEVPTRYPKGDLLSEALWRLAFAAWRGGR